VFFAGIYGRPRRSVKLPDLLLHAAVGLRVLATSQA
jgi:hypothetical protein